MARIAVFSTTDLYVREPVMGRPPIHVDRCGRGHREMYWSTGKLETALARGYETYVVSIRWVFYPCDRWWVDLVPEDRIFHSGLAVVGTFPASELKTRLMSVWRDFYRRIGIPWDESFNEWDEPRTHLVAHHGIVDGSTLPAFSS